MHLTTFTDYSFRILIYLGLQDERLTTIQEIAEHYNISKNHLMKAVRQLGQLGCVETVRGKGGGIRLAQPAREIRIGDVVRRVEENMAIAECLSPPPGRCRIDGACALKGFFREALEAFLAVLDRYTLEDVLNNRALFSKFLKIAPSPVEKKKTAKNAGAPKTKAADLPPSTNLP